MKEKFNEKVIPVILKFINTKAIQSIKNGMVTSMSQMCIRDSVKTMYDILNKVYEMGKSV